MKVLILCITYVWSVGFFAIDGNNMESRVNNEFQVVASREDAGRIVYEQKIENEHTINNYNNAKYALYEINITSNTIKEVSIPKAKIIFE